MMEVFRVLRAALIGAALFVGYVIICELTATAVANAQTPAPTAPIWLLTSPATFAADVTAAQPGATITIPPGNYGAPYLHDKAGLTFNVVTGAKFDGLTLSGFSDFIWDGGYFELPASKATGTGVIVVRIANSHGGVFKNATIKGAIATLGGPENSPLTGNHLINGRPAGLAVSLEFSSGVTLDHLDMSKMFKGISVARGDTLQVTHNTCHDFRTSCIVGDAPSNSLIAYNVARDVHQWSVGGDGDHSEGIHMWNVLGDLLAKQNLRVVGNLIDQDTGDAFPICMSFEDKSGLGFAGALIDGNTCLNGHAQCISAFKTQGALTDNVCLQTAGNANDAPSIRLVGSAATVLLTPGLLVNGNRAADVYRLLTAVQQTGPLGLTPMSNLILAPGVQPANVLQAARVRALALIAAN